MWLPAVLVFARLFLSSLHPHQVSPSGTSDTSDHTSHGALAAGSRASRAVWALSHWEYCHLNSKVCFGGGKIRVLHRRPARYQFALPYPLHSWQTTSNFVFLQIHLQPQSRPATWLWLINVLDNVVINKTLKVKFSSDWMFFFTLRLCFCEL